MEFDTTTTVPAVYMHWPFCPYRCRFCPFIAMAGHQGYMESYSKALAWEVEQFSLHYTGDRNLGSLYIGGGTPSIWPDRLLLDMAGKLNNVFSLKNAEVTLEVNPGTAGKEQFLLWQRIGVNRLSIGVQGLNDAALANLGRYHTAKDVQATLERATEFFNDISIDVIVGLPGVTFHDWKDVIYRVLAWPIKHISLYFLSLHKETRLYGDIVRGKMHLPEEEAIIEQYTWAVNTLAMYGFEQYELSNFAKPGYWSQHNIAYWQRVPYKGFGLGAWSYDGKCRFCAKKNLIAYITAAHEHRSLLDHCEELTNEQVRLEQIMLGLRQTKGVMRKTLLNNCTVHKQVLVRQKLEHFKAEGLVNEYDGWVRLTPKGLLVENSIAVEFA